MKLCFAHLSNEILGSTKIESDYKIEILDQGPGVKSELLNEIFKPFFRTENSRPNTNKNFGLGLALARRQLSTINAHTWAENNLTGGLKLSILVPKNNTD